MYKFNKSDVPQRERAGLLSHILLQQGDVQKSQLAVTWVELAPNAAQKPHHHAPEQCYVIIQGAGTMHVGAERTEVQYGDIVHIPPDVVHFLENSGEQTLIYISAATPTVDFTTMYDQGSLSNTGQQP